MKICIAQTTPIKGNIEKNIENHKKLILLAIKNKADVIVFPELSLTGYEAELAIELAATKEDKRFTIFQKLSNSNNICIAAGLPTKNDKGICISLIIFQPNIASLIYSKAYLHPGEEQYFVPGANIPPISFKNKKLAFAICYETSIANHTEEAFKNNTNVYIASVLNSVAGVDKDIDRISNTAKKYNSIALMANFVGNSGGYDCAGKSSIWNTKGVLVSQLNNTTEGIAIIDLDTEETFTTHF